MPHIIVEHSQNLTTAIDVADLITELHAAAMDMAALPTGGIRTRAYQVDVSRVGDGRADRGFIYITVRLGQGRTEAIKRDIGDTLFGVLNEFTAQYFDDGNALSLGLEVQEIEKDWTWKKNNIHQIIKDETNA